MIKSSTTYWSSNIRHLRLRKKYSQDDLAQRLGMTRSKLNAHENGQSVNPPLQDLLTVSQYFKMSIDTLLKVDLTRLSELKIRDLEAGNDVYITGGKIRVLAISVDKQDQEHVEYVPIQAKAGYQAGYADPEYIATLPRFTFPNIPQQGTFRMFPIKGDSMWPIPDGSDVITRFVEDWKAIKTGTPCIIILNSTQDFVFKIVENHIKSDRSLMLHSLNAQYEPYRVPIAEVVEIWSFYAYVAKEMPAAATDLDVVLKKIDEVKGLIMDNA